MANAKVGNEAEIEIGAEIRIWNGVKTCSNSHRRNQKIWYMAIDAESTPSGKQVADADFGQFEQDARYLPIPPGPVLKTSSYQETVDRSLRMEVVTAVFSRDDLPSQLGQLE